MTSTPARGPVDATGDPRYGGPRHVRPAASPGRGGTRRRRGRRASRSTRASATGPAPGSARPTSAPPPSCCGTSTRSRTSSRSPCSRSPTPATSPATPSTSARRSGQIDEGARAIVGTGARLMTIGGDHTIALPLLRVDARDARPGRGRALRRPPGHLGHLLRRARTPTARRSAGRARRAWSTGPAACTSASGGRSTPPGPHRRPGARLPGGRLPTTWTTSAGVGVVERDPGPRGRPARPTSRSTSTCSTRRSRRAPARPRPAA